MQSIKIRKWRVFKCYCDLYRIFHYFSSLKNVKNFFYYFQVYFHIVDAHEQNESRFIKIGLVDSEKKRPPFEKQIFVKNAITFPLSYFYRILFEKLVFRIRTSRKQFFRSYF